MSDDTRERLHALGNEVQVLRGELLEARSAAAAANARTAHLEALVDDFVGEIRKGASQIREGAARIKRLHTVMRDAVEMARGIPDMARARTFRNASDEITAALSELDSLRRNLTTTADRFLTDTQPMWNPSPPRRDSE